MKKTLLILIVLFICIFMTGCDEKKETTCSIEKDDKEITVTISKKEGKTVVKTEETETKCNNEGLCSIDGNTEEKETEDSFNSVVDNYRKDGYICE